MVGYKPTYLPHLAEVIPLLVIGGNPTNRSAGGSLRSRWFRRRLTGKVDRSQPGELHPGVQH